MSHRYITFKSALSSEGDRAFHAARTPDVFSKRPLGPSATSPSHRGAWRGSIVRRQSRCDPFLQCLARRGGRGARTHLGDRSGLLPLSGPDHRHPRRAQRHAVCPRTRMPPAHAFGKSIEASPWPTQSANSYQIKESSLSRTRAAARTRSAIRQYIKRLILRHFHPEPSHRTKGPRVTKQSRSTRPTNDGIFARWTTVLLAF